jgi:hypothetical protein
MARTLALCVLLTMSAYAWCQDGVRSTHDQFRIPEFSRFEFLMSYFPSELIGNNIDLKSYVRSARYRRIREQLGDLKAVDALYISALRLTRGNTGLALLYCTLATMDHQIVGIKVPLLSTFIPLTGESDHEFLQRVANLPTRIFDDSPVGATGDRDKLQHFFGSAFVANVFESRNAAERVGTFVEEGEASFIVGGVYDRRDLRANRLGHEFGLALIDPENQSTLLPSHFLRLSIATTGPGGDR